MQQRKEVGHDAFHLVGDKHLVAVKLYLVALQLNIRFDSREIEDTCKVEWIVNVEVNPEQRLLHLHGIECAIEALVVLVFQCAGRFGPEWFHIIYNIVLVGINLLAVFPFGLLAKSYWNGQELTILIQQLLYFLFLKKLLAVVINVKNNIRTTVSALGILDGKFWRSVAAPFHGCSTFLITACDDFHLLRYHETGVEAQSEVSDNGIGRVFILIEEVGDARESNLVDVFINLLCRHTNTTVADGEGSVFLVKADMHGKVAQLAF